ncbi:3-ketoacyl-CoA thiolase [Aeromicrobium sp. SMF47]|uniref:3-ketoacyl-CoA thiolase n=2 Tax=Aeromicrobium yanjiei TaxID=2662028 RepID=A0A5Q2MJB7_9ACTN|nr:OB-fold domain-containing protein [Aeromicrobium sp. S22]MRJ77255.1 3-ketoacyl-CoA thiolase [Aeromicrobium yanjiei]MRK01623.1 3-ketoacyl-CoA thiolase [Aeromicrobium sp. S22]QGG43244.1 3-ketoacyl-CoA thiolase [Aeromicrobium yanjiei]
MTTSEVVRPLPQPTLASADFWSAGADGELRIARCDDCSTYMHPPLPTCRSCRSINVTMTPVSGRAVVVGFTVNSQHWLPSFPPPYVVAIVALEEDDGARLMTNIVNCEPEAVAIGMRVRVLFEKAEEVYLPLFEPDPDAGPELGPIPAQRDVAAALRPMASSKKFEDDVALTGVGQSRVGRRLMVDPLSLTVEASLKAIEDAGLTIDEIDGLATYPGNAPAGMSEGGVMAVEEALQIRPTWVNGGGETPGQIGSIMAAMLAVSAGLCRHVLCFRTVWQGSYSAMTRSGAWKVGNERATGMMEWRAPFGAVSAANWIACNASNYFHTYGGGRETLGHIAINARKNAMLNPEAVYRDPMTMDDYMSARMVTSPFGLFDCDVPVDGAIAVIVSAAETVKDRPKPAVFVEAVGTQIMERLSWDQDTLTHLPQTLGPSAHLWSRTSLTPEDVDVAQLYDGFTFNCLSYLEALGFCELGGAKDFIDEGRGIALDGRLPLNTHGGQLSAGRLHGYGFVREAMLQLRGEATGRQVAGAQVAAVAAGGGVPSGVMLLRGA